MNGQKIAHHLEELDKCYKEYWKYLGLLRLLKEIFTIKSGKTWEDSIYEALNTLSEREKRVITMRFGLDGNFMNLEETGREFGVTRERIRQIEAKALRKLKHPSRKLVLLGQSWQMAVQEAKSIGEKLLATHSISQKEQYDKKLHNLVTIEMIDLPTRVANALRREGYDTVDIVEQKTDAELLRVRNIGIRSINLIRRKIAESINQTKV